MKHYLTVPNCLTFLRLLGALTLPFLTPLSLPFFAVYTVCGITDALDGFFARRYQMTSEFGARLDSVADLLFYASLLWSIWPTIWERLPAFVFGIAGAAVAVRVLSYLTALLKYRRFSSLHTYLNKLTGLLVFFLPYTLCLPLCAVYGAVVAAVALLSSAEEELLHLLSPVYTPEHKSLLSLRKPSGK